MATEENTTPQAPAQGESPAGPDYEPGTPVTVDGRADVVERVYVRQGRAWLQLRGGMGCWADAAQPRILPDRQSPTPWSLRHNKGSYSSILSADKLLVLNLYLEETARLDGDIIIRAVNTHVVFRDAILRARACLTVAADKHATPEETLRALTNLLTAEAVDDAILIAGNATEEERTA